MKQFLAGAILSVYLVYWGIKKSLLWKAQILAGNEQDEAESHSLCFLSECLRVIFLIALLFISACIQLLFLGI